MWNSLGGSFGREENMLKSIIQKLCKGDKLNYEQKTEKEII